MDIVEEGLKTVDDLNSLLFNEETPESEFGYCFEFSSTGYAQIIEFAGITLWSSEDDERMYNEDKDDYEPLCAFVKSKFVELRKELNKIKI